MAGKKRFYRTDTSPDNFRALWDRIHDLSDQLTAQDLIIRDQAGTITSLQSNLTTVDRAARNALIASSSSPEVPIARPVTGGGSGSPGPGPPGPPPGPGIPPGTGICTSQPLSASLPGWFSTALQGAGQPTTSNCYDPAKLLAIEATCNANDFTLQRDSGCNVRGRLYHQGNHGIWGTFCGLPDASGVADYSIDVVVTNSDGTVSWGWV